VHRWRRKMRYLPVFCGLWEASSASRPNSVRSGLCRPVALADSDLRRRPACAVQDYLCQCRKIFTAHHRGFTCWKGCQGSPTYR
jgi:hypothetical protein